MTRKVSLAAAFDGVEEPWTPKIVGELNGQYVKVARFEGPYVWHRHAVEDELFLVLDGRVRIELRDGAVDLGPGEMLVVPRGVEHRPVAEGSARVLLFEPVTTRSTGDVDADVTLDPEDLERL